MSPRRTLALMLRLLKGGVRSPRGPALLLAAPAVVALAAALVLTSTDPYGGRWILLERFLPAVLAIAGFLVPALVSSAFLRAQKRQGTVDRLLTTPLRVDEMTAGFAAYHLALSVPPAAALTAIVVVLAPVVSVGRSVLVFLCLLILCLGGAGLGVLVAPGLRSRAAAELSLPLAGLPVILLSGVLWPVAALPAWLRPVSRLLPPYHALEACRALLFRGAGARPGAALAWLCGLGAALWVAVALRLRRGRAGR